MFPCKELFGVLDLDIVLGKQKSLRARGKFAGREPVRRMGRGSAGLRKLTQISPFTNALFFSFTQTSHI